MCDEYLWHYSIQSFCNRRMNFHTFRELLITHAHVHTYTSCSMYAKKTKTKTKLYLARDSNWLMQLAKYSTFSTFLKFLTIW